MKKKLYYTTKDIAKITGFTRQEITRKIWVGQIVAQKVAGVYLIHYTQVKKLRRKI